MLTPDRIQITRHAAFTEHGDAIRAMAFDGTEAESKPEDAGLFMRTTRQVRGAA